MDLKAIGARIKAERKKAELTQKALSEMIDVTPHYIYQIERGMKVMSVETLMRLSEALKISVDYILHGVQQRHPGEMYKLLSEMSDERRLRVEEAIETLIPYLR